jgi:hypothetical protein
MRIVGGKDYYDSASAYGIDPGITFVRDNRVVTRGDAEKMGTWSASILTLSENIEKPQDPPKGWRCPSVSSYRTMWDKNDKLYGDEYTIEGHAVLFCGKVYKGFTVRIRDGRNYLEKEVVNFWTASRLEKWAAEKNLIASPGQYGHKTLEDLFKVGEIGSDSRIQTHIEMGIAIAWKKEPEVHSNGPYNSDDYKALDSGWRINCDGLKSIGFQSAVDPVTAFQELSMWVGGTLSSKGPNTVEITDDKIKLAKHGMDKWSFRKQGKNSKV